jgi:hypothetical protein
MVRTKENSLSSRFAETGKNEYTSKGNLLCSQRKLTVKKKVFLADMRNL